MPLELPTLFWGDGGGPAIFFYLNFYLLFFEKETHKVDSNRLCTYSGTSRIIREMNQESSLIPKRAMQRKVLNGFCMVISLGYYLDKWTGPRTWAGGWLHLDK